MAKKQQETNIREFINHRLTFTPVGFDRGETVYGPHDRMWAEVYDHTTGQHLGTLAMWYSKLINQVKQHYVGRPITATLREGPDPDRRMRSLFLADIEEN